MSQPFVGIELCSHCSEDVDARCAVCREGICAEHMHVEVTEYTEEIIRCPDCCDGRCGQKGCEPWRPEER